MNIEELLNKLKQVEEEKQNVLNENDKLKQLLQSYNDSRKNYYEKNKEMVKAKAKQGLKKPKRKGETEICHGLLRCQSVKPKCEIIHNRDKNAVQNMLEIVHSIFTIGKRPDVFCREVNS